MLSKLLGLLAFAAVGIAQLTHTTGASQIATHPDRAPISRLAMTGEDAKALDTATAMFESEVLRPHGVTLKNFTVRLLKYEDRYYVIFEPAKGVGKPYGSGGISASTGFVYEIDRPSLKVGRHFSATLYPN